MAARLPGIIRHDPMRKAVALFFAILIWGVVRRQIGGTDTREMSGIPVQITYDRSRIHVEDGPVPLVNVTVRGSRKRIQEADPTEIELELRLPDAIQEGQQSLEITLTSRHVKRKPRQVSVDAFHPRSVMVHVDRIKAKPARVEVTTRGEVREGYRVVQVRPVPAEVSLTGPSRVLRDIVSVQAEPVELSETVVMSYEEQRELRRIPKVSMPAWVKVEVVVERVASTPRVVRDLPMAVLAFPTCGLQPAEPLPSVTLTLRGPVAALEALSETGLAPFVDLSGITSPGRYRRQVRVWFQPIPGITVEPPTPAWVDLDLVPVAMPESPAPGAPAVPGTVPAVVPPGPLPEAPAP